MRFDSPYFEALDAEIRRLGGLYNAHLHLDRAGTLEITSDLGGASHLALSAKHRLIPHIHASSAYDPDILARRVSYYLDAMVAAGTRRAATLVDVTADRVRLSALEVFQRLRAERRNELQLEIGAYSPLGFRDDEPGRWELLQEGARQADFIGALPERDDRRDYPEHIGFRENCRRMLGLAHGLGKSLHIHVDQRNEPSERGAEILLDVMDEMKLAPRQAGEPWVWMIHVISPSTYEEARFQDLVERMARLGVGVICCPSAAISMRQLRPRSTPTYNSIARVLEFLAAGIPVRVGSDNICDITSPAGTPDLRAEIYVLANAVRFYDLGVMAQLAAGVSLDDAARERIRTHLAQDRSEVERILQKYQRPGPDD